jgi:anti-sigma28 factor (negative regulator of flagellin synthesis)
MTGKSRKRKPRPNARQPGSADHQLRQALHLVGESPEARERRLEALRAAIASGAYEPDAHQIAREILEHGL